MDKSRFDNVNVSSFDPQVQKNKIASASEALIWLRGKRYDPSVELAEMQLAIEQQKEAPESIAAAMFRRSSVKALSISFGLFICQQMCGINVVIFYTTDIFAVSQNSETMLLVTLSFELRVHICFRAPKLSSVPICQRLWLA